MTCSNTDQRKNPLHSITLEMILIRLVDHYGWEELGTLVVTNCFNNDAGIQSRLKLLCRTPRARKKVKTLYLGTRFS
jgi:uncharacterized protein (DUF2132 family)